MKYRINGSETVGLKPGSFVVGEDCSYVVFNTIENAQHFVEREERIDARMVEWKAKNGNRKMKIEEWKEIVGWGK